MSSLSSRAVAHRLPHRLRAPRLTASSILTCAGALITMVALVVVLRVVLHVAAHGDLPLYRNVLNALGV